MRKLLRKCMETRLSHFNLTASYVWPVLQGHEGFGILGGVSNFLPLADHFGKLHSKQVHGSQAGHDVRLIQAAEDEPRGSRAPG